MRDIYISNKAKYSENIVIIVNWVILLIKKHLTHLSL